MRKKKDVFLNLTRSIYGFLILILFLFILYSAVVHSVSQTITVVENPQPIDQGWSLGKFFKQYWFIILLVILLLIGLIFLLIWIINKIKEGKDVWYQVWKHKKHLCKMHKDKWRIRAFFRYSKNNPIRIMWVNDSKVHSRVIGNYRGHYNSHEGNISILFNCRRKWMIFPRNDLLLINTNKKMVLYQKKEVEIKGKKEIVREAHTLELPSNFITFGQDEIIIQACSIDMDIRTNFYYPVIKDRDGQVINMFFPTYESMKEIVIESYLFDQTDDFVKVAKKSIDLNPLIRGHNKVLDNSSSIETQEATVRK